MHMTKTIKFLLCPMVIYKIVFMYTRWSNDSKIWSDGISVGKSDIVLQIQ